MELKYATLMGMTSTLDDKHYIDLGVMGENIRLSVSKDAIGLVFNIIEMLQNHSFSKHESFLLKVAINTDGQIVAITDTSESLWITLDPKYLSHTEKYIEVNSLIEKAIKLKEAEDRISELETKLYKVISFATNSKITDYNLPTHKLELAISDAFCEEYDKGYGDGQSSM